VPLANVEREEMRFLTPAEVATLADAIHTRYRALVLVGAYGGLRIGELAGLRRCRVDLLRGSVQVAEIVVEVRGVLHIGPPKTRASRRMVGLPRFVVEELAAHLADATDPEAFVFTAPKGGPLRVTGFRARVWRPATRAAGVDGLRIHDLRHTAVALWIAAGANPKEVAARAGHASVSFTLDRYGHLYPEGRQRAPRPPGRALRHHPAHTGRHRGLTQQDEYQIDPPRSLDAGGCRWCASRQGAPTPDGDLREHARSDPRTKYASAARA
jgi:integrase